MGVRSQRRLTALCKQLGQCAAAPCAATAATAPTETPPLSAALDAISWAPASLNAAPLAPLEKIGYNMKLAGTKSEDPLAPSLDVADTKLFENERVIIWDMTVSVAGKVSFTGGNTGWHKHIYNYCFLQIGPQESMMELLTSANQLRPNAPLEPAPQATKEVPVKRTVNQNTLGDRSVTWLPASEEKPVIHKLFNDNPDQCLRQILIEFKEKAPKHTPEEFKAIQARAHARGHSTDVGTKLLLENERCKVWDFSFAPHSGEEVGFHQHTTDYFFIATCGGRNNPGQGTQGLRGWAGITEKELKAGVPQNTNFVTTDSDLVFTHIPADGGFAADGSAIHMDKLWNHLDAPYSSFVVEIK